MHQGVCYLESPLYYYTLCVCSLRHAQIFLKKIGMVGFCGQILINILLDNNYLLRVCPPQEVYER